MRLSHLGAHITCLIFRIKAFHINVKQKKSFILGCVAQIKRTFFATLFLHFCKKNLFWPEFIDFSSVFEE